MYTIRHGLLALVFAVYPGHLLASELLVEENRLPLVLHGLCPFECCQYGDWQATESINLYSEALYKQSVTATLSPGEDVEANTGLLVINRVGQIDIIREHTSEISEKTYLVGDQLMAYAYLGEGIYKVSLDGSPYDEFIPFPPTTEGNWSLCMEEGDCFGKWVSQPSQTWWVNIKDRNGNVGWTDRPDLFSGKGSCG